MNRATLTKRHPIGRLGIPTAIGLIAVATALVAPTAEAKKSSASQRAERRLYDGAPPVIPHTAQGAACNSCHNAVGLDVPDLGFAPPNPHEHTDGVGLVARCKQCHVEQTTESEWRASEFEGLAQDMRSGKRLNTLAPPVIPHLTFMRENCAACHAGPAAREEIRTSHPERARCRQCHVEKVTSASFPGAEPEGSQP